MYRKSLPEKKLILFYFIFFTYIVVPLFRFLWFLLKSILLPLSCCIKPPCFLQKEEVFHSNISAKSTSGNLYRKKDHVKQEQLVWSNTLDSLCEQNYNRWGGGEVHEVQNIMHRKLCRNDQIHRTNRLHKQLYRGLKGKPTSIYFIFKNKTVKIVGG